VFIDDRLNWKQHVDSVAMKASRNQGVIRRVSKYGTRLLTKMKAAKIWGV